MVRAMPRDLHLVDSFFTGASDLRDHFDDRFADPRGTRADRFVWDFWHVPGQYTALRTPAWTYFPPRVYDAFHQRLVWWGRRVLGCHDVSPPWLSNYVEGCRQELHGDLPHGPWAFVYSLTPWQGRRFTGGETLLLRPEVLDFWGDFRSTRAVEEPELVRAVPPKFNRLVVFDPRIPHGVRRVEGTMDPREGRLVVHGWFVQPRPFIEGPLHTKSLEGAIGEVTKAITPVLSAGLPLAGLLSVGFTVTPAGETKGYRVLSDTTRVPSSEEPGRRELHRAIRRALSSHRFPKGRKASQVTLPLVFER